MDPIKEAFNKIKEEISAIREEVTSLSKRVTSLEIQQNFVQNSVGSETPTDSSAHNPTLPQEVGGSRMPYLGTSTGSRGVPTDKPTNKQTNQQTDAILQINTPLKESIPPLALEQAKHALESLDSIKKDIRLKFKRLTNKEMMVFTTIYSLEERGIEEITYKLLANNLNLTESSIRDYANKLISKGVPLQKIKKNNKQIFLRVSSDFQRIASLQTVLRLRDL